MVEAVSLTKSGATLRMGGPFQDDGLEQELRTIDGLSQTELLGWLNREEIQSLFEKSVGGLVTLQPAPNHLEALPVKMFEYMSAGLPVIASNFPLWREIIVETDCGICVDPTNVQQIAEAIDELVVNPDRAQEMGGNGQRAVQRKYNWDKEAEKLVDFYDRLIEA